MGQLPQQKLVTKGPYLSQPENTKKSNPSKKLSYAIKVNTQIPESISDEAF